METTEPETAAANQNESIIGVSASRPLAPGPWPLTDAVLLVGHGTRDAAGIAEFLLLADRVRGLMAPRTLEACFLELAQPTIGDGLRRLIGGGAKRITVVPLLLTAAGHAKRDIPQAIAAVSNEVSAKQPELIIRQTTALDCHPRIVDLSTRRFDEALSEREILPREQTLLLFVGRGSSDAGAVATVRRFAALRAERSRVGRLETCFAAVAKPSLDEILPLVARAGWRRIVVQPHLLFRGRLLADVREGVLRFQIRETASDARRQTEWIVAEPLGPEPELAEAVCDLIRALDA